MFNSNRTITHSHTARTRPGAPRVVAFLALSRTWPAASCPCRAGSVFTRPRAQQLQHDPDQHRHKHTRTENKAYRKQRADARVGRRDMTRSRSTHRPRPAPSRSAPSLSFVTCRPRPATRQLSRCGRCENRFCSCVQGRKKFVGKSAWSSRAQSRIR